jgi:hypothetical protein
MNQKKKDLPKTYLQYRRKKDGKFVGKKYADRYPHLTAVKRVKRKPTSPAVDPVSLD